MTLAIHLIDPVKRHTPPYITMRCGLTRHATKDAHESTTDPAKVTCKKCQGYLANPWRVLRKYGHVKVVESGFVVVSADYGYPFDLVAVPDVPGKWTVRMAAKSQLHDVRNLQACNMTDLGFQLAELYEKQLTEHENL